MYNSFTVWVNSLQNLETILVNKIPSNQSLISVSVVNAIKESSYYWEVVVITKTKPKSWWKY